MEWGGGRRWTGRKTHLLVDRDGDDGLVGLVEEQTVLQECAYTCTLRTEYAYTYTGCMQKRICIYINIHTFEQTEMRCM
jgi:hypothetical protein